MDVPGHQHDATVKQLLDQARSALASSNASQALQCVIEALKLVRGDNAVIPTLQHAAEQYHMQRAAPIQEISALLAQVSLHTEQQQLPQQPQQQQLQQPAHVSNLWPAQQQQHHHHQQQQQQQFGMPHSAYSGAETMQGQQGKAWQQQQQQQQMQSYAGTSQGHCGTAILDETGRGEFANMALADGSSWQCPHCSGVVPMQRRNAHLDLWCPNLHGGVSGDDMQQ